MSAIVTLEKVRTSLGELRLRYMPSILDSVLEQAAREDAPALEVLDELLEHEKAERWASRVVMTKKMSALPQDKTLESFDFAFQPSLDKSRLLEMATARFVANRENAIFLGPPGVGKTHLACGLGLKAIEQGYRVLFINAHELILRLKRWSDERKLLQKWSNFKRIALVIIDEMGYLPIDADGASLLFQLLNQRYEQSSTIVTSNLSFGDWGKFLGSDMVASAILDRLLHHGSIVNIRGDSYRLREKKKAGLLPSVQILSSKEHNDGRS